MAAGVSTVTAGSLYFSRGCHCHANTSDNGADCSWAEMHIPAHANSHAKAASTQLLTSHFQRGERLWCTRHLLTSKQRFRQNASVWALKITSNVWIKSVRGTPCISICLKRCVNPKVVAAPSPSFRRSPCFLNIQISRACSQVPAPIFLLTASSSRPRARPQLKHNPDICWIKGKTHSVAWI